MVNKLTYKVIIIDDESWTRKVIKHLGEWEKLGLEVVAEASDGKYGYELITRLQPNIIITDIVMPHFSGIDLLSLIRAKGNHAKVIIISGFDDFKYTKSAVQLNANDYLLKPLKPDELNEQLKRCVEELDREAQGNKSNDFELNGFLNVSWIEEYNSFHTSLYEALFSNDHKILMKKITDMENLIISKEVDSNDKGFVVCIYYDLLNLLQRFIINRGYTTEEVFEGKVTSFVFGEECTLKDVLAFISRLYQEVSVKVRELIKFKNRIDIQQIENYIEANYARGISLEETANRFYVSKEYLSKVFKEKTGFSFSECVTMLRMQKAKALVIEAKVPLKEIGSLIGYEDVSYFYKVFKKYFDITPGKMQERLKNYNE